MDRQCDKAKARIRDSNVDGVEEREAEQFEVQLGREMCALFAKASELADYEGSCCMACCEEARTRRLEDDLVENGD